MNLPWECPRCGIMNAPFKLTCSCKRAEIKLKKLEICAENEQKEEIKKNFQSLLTVKLFCEKHNFIKAGGLRNLIFFKDSNGLLKSGAILKLGRKVLIDEEKLLNWIKNHNAK